MIDGLLPVGDVLTHPNVGVASEFDAIDNRRSVAPFVTDLMVLGHVGCVGLGCFAQLGRKLERAFMHALAFGVVSRHE